MNFSGYNPQQAYDPSQQIQPYDQSLLYQPYYYAYNNYNNNPQYAYFPSHGYTVSDTQQPHLQFQPEPTPVHPPGVPPTAPEPVPHRATHAPTGPSQYRGTGGRGGRPFRGGSRGQFNHQGPAPNRGRGRGLGGGRHFKSHSSGLAVSNVADASGATSVAQVQPSSISEQMPLPKPAQVPAAPLQPPSRKALCEICKVECNTPEVLEQHKNGKRHKKNLKVHEESQRCKAINGQQSGQISTPQLNLTEQPKKVQESEKKGCPTENRGSEVTADNHKDKIELQNIVGETSEVPAVEPEGKSTDNSVVKGRGLKRKLKGGRGSKFIRTNDGSRRPVEPPKPEQAKSFICELCNVKCESQVVYHSHLNGKKHLSSLKRVRAHGHQALSGVAGLQGLYPPDINALLSTINAQVQQGDSDPQVLLAQLLMTVLSQAQVPAIAQPSGPVAAQIPAPSSVAGTSYEPQFQNVSQTQVSEITAHVEIENSTRETEKQLLSVPLELDAPAGSKISTPIAGESSETREKVLKDPQDSLGMTPADNSSAANDQMPS